MWQVPRAKLVCPTRVAGCLGMNIVLVELSLNFPAELWDSDRGHERAAKKIDGKYFALLCETMVRNIYSVEESNIGTEPRDWAGHGGLTRWLKGNWFFQPTKTHAQAQILPSHILLSGFSLFSRWSYLLGTSYSPLPLLF